MFGGNGLGRATREAGDALEDDSPGVSGSSKSNDEIKRHVELGAL